jgi:two-component system response regulator FixJ
LEQVQIMSSGPGRTPKIYVLDDDAAVRDSMQILLETDSYRVETFETVTEVMEGLLETSCLPACVILDVHLPDGDGRAACARIKTDRPGVPVILMSGQNRGTLGAEAEAAGAFAFLDKPINQDELFAVIARAVAS